MPGVSPAETGSTAAAAADVSLTRFFILRLQ